MLKFAYISHQKLLVLPHHKSCALSVLNLTISLKYLTVNYLKRILCYYYFCFHRLILNDKSLENSITSRDSTIIWSSCILIYLFSVSRFMLMPYFCLKQIVWAQELLVKLLEYKVTSLQWRLPVDRNVFLSQQQDSRFKVAFFYPFDQHFNTN